MIAIKPLKGRSLERRLNQRYMLRDFKAAVLPIEDLPQLGEMVR